MEYLVGAIFVICWFLLCTSGMFTFVAMLRGKTTNMNLAVPFLIIFGLPGYFSGSYLRENVDHLSNFVFWIPAVLGVVVGAFAGYGAETKQ